MYETKENTGFQFGRLVRVIAFTGFENKIPLNEAYIDLRNSFGNNLNLKVKLSGKALENYQKSIWNLFTPYFNPDLNDNSGYVEMFRNDELNEDYQTTEGKILYRQHRTYERDSSITHKKKQIARRESKLFCEVCGFSFLDVYGEEYIECHHVVPISEGVRETKLEDLCLVCSNCHRMLHRKIDDKYLSIEDLKKIISKI